MSCSWGRLPGEAPGYRRGGVSSSLAGNIALIRAVRVRNILLLLACPERSGQSPWEEAAEAAGRTGDPDGQDPVPRVSHRLPSAPLLQPLAVLPLAPAQWALKQN